MAKNFAGLSRGQSDQTLEQSGGGPLVLAEDVRGGGIGNYTTTERDAIAGTILDNNMLIYNVTTNRFEQYSGGTRSNATGIITGGTWSVFSGGGGGGDYPHVVSPEDVMSGRAGAWDIVLDSQSDLSTILDGAGVYRMMLVGQGGSTPSTAFSTGGGAGGFAIWTLTWDGTDALACVLGSTTTFSVDGSTRITCTAGAAGLNTSAEAQDGGAGGTATLTLDHSSISDETFRTGGRGGNASNRFGITGGGGVNIFGAPSTNGGDNTSSSTNSATAGGGAFGPGANVSADLTYSSSATPSSAGITYGAGGNNHFEETPGGHNLFGSFLGTLPPGRSVSGTVANNPRPGESISVGLCGGAVGYGSGGPNSQSGYIFGGGGGSGRTGSGGSSAAHGGIGAGAGGGGNAQSNGGQGAFLYLKLEDA